MNGSVISRPIAFDNAIAQVKYLRAISVTVVGAKLRASGRLRVPFLAMA
jgi:hypothetical protein